MVSIKLKVAGSRKLDVSLEKKKIFTADIGEIRAPIQILDGISKVGLNNNELVAWKRIESKSIIVFTRDEKLYISSWIDTFYRPHSRFIPFLRRSKLIFIGMLHYDIKDAYKDFDVVALQDYVTSVKRPFAFIPGMRRIAYFSIELSQAVLDSDRMHQSLELLSTHGFRMPVRTFKFIKSKDKSPLFLKRRLVGDFVVVLRTVDRTNRLTVSRSPYNSLYEWQNILKNRIALVISKVYPRVKINLLFEKESERAEESGFYVFKKLQEDKSLSSRNYFVLSKDYADYKKIKQEYGRKIIAKHSFRHFLYTYISGYLISSELSFHLFNPRVYINTLRRTIASKPLVFLQHGIMFAKPVENPAARGFYKENSEVNVYRSVISSELEATQFYKMGYKRKELIKCGLPKFDMQNHEQVRDKIVFMPTYRYWEEGLVNAGRIEETTYYQTIKSLLETFQENKLLDNFIVTSHPKFSDYIVKLFPNFKDNIEPDTTKAVESAKIFITDFSSASYDAHLGGAYPIYYWEERKYLESCYKAKSALKKSNADGPVAYSKEELISMVKDAMAHNYQLAAVYENNYKKINEFNDGKNADRLIKYLKKNNIV